MSEHHGMSANCPHCHAELTRQEVGVLLSALRTVHAGGRPRSDKQRCPCGVMTVARATARNHVCIQLIDALESVTKNVRF